MRSVDECVAIALREHPALQAAEAKLQASRFHPALALSAGLPKVSAEYSASRRKATLGALTEAPSDSVLGIEDTYRYQVGEFSVTQMLWDFGKTLKLWRAAQAEVESKSADREAVAQSVVLGVKRAYFGLVAAARFLAVAEQTESRSALLLRVARDRFDTGLSPEFDVVKQEAVLASAQVHTLTARNILALAAETLRDAMGLEQPLDFVPDDRALAFSPVEVREEEALERAHARRAELTAVAARKKAARDRIAALIRDYLPIAVGRAEYNFTGENAEDEGWLVGALVRMPIFDGGVTAARLGEARAQLLEVEAEEKHVRQQVALDVRESVLNVTRGLQAIGASEKAVRAAQEASRVAETRYESGVGDVVELTTSEVAYFAAQTSHVRLLAEYRSALADLDRATGARLPVEARLSR